VGSGGERDHFTRGEIANVVIRAPEGRCARQHEQQLLVVMVEMQRRNDGAGLELVEVGCKADAARAFGQTDCSECRAASGVDLGVPGRMMKVHTHDDIK
jgi:hypothetical protein